MTSNYFVAADRSAAASDRESSSAGRERKLNELLRRLRFSSRGDLVIPMMTFNASSDDDTCSNHASSSAPPAPAPRKANLGATSHIFVVVGATGHLAKRMIYPALWSLFCNGDLPGNVYVVGVARSELSLAELKQELLPHMEIRESEQEKATQFWRRCYYAVGDFAKVSSLERLLNILKELEHGFITCNRIFYLAIPVTAYYTTTRSLHEHCLSRKGWNRVVVEKPYWVGGLHLSIHLLSLFNPEQLVRIDHFLDHRMLSGKIC
jgi:hypothetical protein